MKDWIMKSKLLLMAIFLFAVFGSILAYNLFRDFAKELYMKERDIPAVTVSVSDATSQTWQPTLAAIGTLTAIQGVEVTTQVSGKVVKILFEDGQSVNQGDPLVVLDDSVQQAQLKNARASLSLAQDAVVRFRPLLASGAISQFHMDRLIAEREEAQAQVEQAQANLNHLHIAAPFTGRLGIRQVSLGQMVQSGAAIVTLDTQGTLFVDFYIPEQNLSQVVVGQSIAVTTDSLPDKTFPGTITAISPSVDPNTRNVNLRASLPNEDNALTPGGFANVAINLKQQVDVISIPKTAVAYTLYGDTVYVVDAKTEKEHDKKKSYQVKRVSVKPGMEQGNEVAIPTGIPAGSKVVTSGQLKLQDGTWVVFKDDPLKIPETMPLE